MVSDYDYKHRCLVEKNVPIVLILPSRWQDGAESLGIEGISCLWLWGGAIAASATKLGDQISCCQQILMQK